MDIAHELDVAGIYDQSDMPLYDLLGKYFDPQVHEDIIDLLQAWERGSIGTEAFYEAVGYEEGGFCLYDVLRGQMRSCIEWGMQKALPLLRKDSRVLDIGCAGGLEAMLYSKVAGKVIGLDRSETLVKYAATFRGMSGATYGVGDSEQLPILDGSVDIAFAFHMLAENHKGHVFDIVSQVREVARVLVPEGSFGFIVNTYNEEEHRHRLAQGQRHCQSVGLQVVSHDAITLRTRKGRDHTFLWCLAQKTQ